MFGHKEVLNLLRKTTHHGGKPVQLLLAVVPEH